MGKADIFKSKIIKTIIIVLIIASIILALFVIMKKNKQRMERRMELDIVENSRDFSIDNEELSSNKDIPKEVNKGKSDRMKNPYKYVEYQDADEIQNKNKKDLSNEKALKFRNETISLLFSNGINSATENILKIRESYSTSGNAYKAHIEPLNVELGLLAAVLKNIEFEQIEEAKEVLDDLNMVETFFYGFLSLKPIYRTDLFLNDNAYSPHLQKGKLQVISLENLKEKEIENIIETELDKEVEIEKAIRIIFNIGREKFNSVFTKYNDTYRVLTLNLEEKVDEEVIEVGEYETVTNKEWKELKIISID